MPASSRGIRSLQILQGSPPGHARYLSMLLFQISRKHRIEALFTEFSTGLSIFQQGTTTIYKHCLLCRQHILPAQSNLQLQIRSYLLTGVIPSRRSARPWVLSSKADLMWCLQHLQCFPSSPLVGEYSPDSRRLPLNTYLIARRAWAALMQGIKTVSNFLVAPLLILLTV